MGDYTDSKACKLLASNCAACSKELVDSKSIEIGLGPICRKKHGYDSHITEENRTKANKLVYLIAAKQTGAEVIQAVNELNELGFTKLAKRISKRIAKIIVTEIDEDIQVSAPYDFESLSAWRKIAFWNRKNKAWTLRTNDKKALWNLLKRFYSNHYGSGNKGIFAI